MKKNIEIIILSIGLILIMIGILLYFVNNSSNAEKDKDIKEKIIVNTSNKVGDEIENDNYQLLLNNGLKNINVRDYNNYQYTFVVPEEAMEYYLDDYAKDLRMNNMSISSYITNNFDLDDFTADVKGQFGEEFNKFNYSYTDNIEIDGHKAMYIKYEALSDTMEMNEDRKKAYEEKFAIVVENEDRYFVLIYYYRHRKSDDSILSEFINGIKITQISNLPSYNKVEDGFITGTIKQNDSNGYEHGYEISYKISSEDYKVDDTNRNSINSSYFRGNNSDSILSYKVHMTYNENGILDEIIASTKSYYQNMNYELKDYKLVEKKYQDKTLYQINISYLDKISGNEKYYIEVIDKLENTYAVSVSLDSGEKIKESEFYKLLNYNIDKY